MTDVQVLERGDDWQCPSMEERERARNKIHQVIASVIATTTSATTMPTMTSTYTCNGTPGWRRVAFINMTDTSYNCPTGLNLTLYSKRTCEQSHTTRFGGCSSTTFSVGGLTYRRVFGRIRGYQFGAAKAFLPLYSRNRELLCWWCKSNSWSCWKASAYLDVCSWRIRSSYQLA